MWIPERLQPILIELSKSRTESPLVVQRATIVWRAYVGQLNEQIAKEIDLGAHQVGVWRRRWQTTWEELTALECREPRRLREVILEVFRDAPRSGCPGTFTAEQVTQDLVLNTCHSGKFAGDFNVDSIFESNDTYDFRAIGSFEVRHLS
ncbi:MAG: hypothetical protein IT427_02195 [Pirellulales bacterium]|nr:hypothetical protein [Pirellulales bacterium]